MSQATFQKALGRLVNDTAYRQSVEQNPAILGQDFDLSKDESQTLMSVWSAATGDDVQGHLMSVGTGGGISTGGLGDIYCCCCCCA
jgi:hypothetical protein